jgi:hypothetical protein
MMLNDLLYRLRALFGRKRMERDLDDEVRLHFEQQVEKFVRQGMARQEAVRQVRLLFGCIDEVKEECRDARGGRRRFRPRRRLVRRTRPGRPRLRRIGSRSADDGRSVAGRAAGCRACGCSPVVARLTSQRRPPPARRLNS